MKDQYIGRSIYNQSVFTSPLEKNLIGQVLLVDIKRLRSTDFALEATL